MPWSVESAAVWVLVSARAWGSGGLSGAGKEESVTLLPGLPPCSPLRPYFLQSPLGSGFCPAEPSHLFMAVCWHEPEKVPCSSEVVFGCTSVPFQSRE